MSQSRVDAEVKIIFLNTIGVLGHIFCFDLYKFFLTERLRNYSSTKLTANV